LTHGPFQWTVRRRYKHFTHLSQKLSLYKMALAIPLPTRQHRERRETARHLGGVSAHRLPSLPTLPDTFVREDNAEARAELLEQFMNAVLADPLYRERPEVVSFAF
jgi:phospholipase D1/2